MNPQESESTPKENPDPNVAHAPSGIPEAGPLVRVLFADDEEQFRVGLARRLERAGFTCVQAVNGADALKRLGESEFDVMLADIDMPGNQHLELLANMPAAAAVPTILLTGRPAVETAARSVEYRVAAYLLKPPEFEELCRVLRTAAQEGRDFRRLRDSRTRLQHWEQELAHLQRLLTQPSAEGRTTAMRSYLRVTLRNLVVSLVELENLLISDSADAAGSRAVERQELLGALRKTVSVLEKTKGQFKSKELGDLRKEIEAILP